MPLYTYSNPTNIRKKTVKIISAIFIILGVFMILWVAFPILSFNLLYAHKFGEIISPLPETKKDADRSGNQTMIKRRVPKDYTKASIWFPQAESIISDPNSPDISDYTLSIPKLNIENARVVIGGENLTESLIHFTGPLPGKPGNSVIFGHSTIIWLYNPEDYKSIFSKLPDLDKGDKIFLQSDNIRYLYKIEEMKIVSPTDLSVLEQNNDGISFITLITCVPPGTYFKRLAVKAVLEGI